MQGASFVSFDHAYKGSFVIVNIFRSAQTVRWGRPDTRRLKTFVACLLFKLLVRVNHNNQYFNVFFGEVGSQEKEYSSYASENLTIMNDPTPGIQISS